MITDLTKMSKEERSVLYLQSTYFNLHFNRSSRYRGVFNNLSPLFHNRDRELWCIITNTARALKHRAVGMQIPRSFTPYKDNPQGISHSRMVCLLDSLEKEGYFDFYRGGLLGMNEEDKMPSIYVPTKQYLSLWSGIDVSKEKSENPLLQEVS